MDDFKFCFFLFIAFLFGIAVILGISFVLSLIFMPLHPVRYILSLFVGIPAAICFVFIPFLNITDKYFNWM